MHFWFSYEIMRKKHQNKIKNIISPYYMGNWNFTHFAPFKRKTKSVDILLVALIETNQMQKKTSKLQESLFLAAALKFYLDKVI